MRQLKTTLITAGILTLGSLAAIASPTWQKVTAGADSKQACWARINAPIEVLVPVTTTFDYIARGGGGGGAAGSKGGDGPDTGSAGGVFPSGGGGRLQRME